MSNSSYSVKIFRDTVVGQGYVMTPGMSGAKRSSHGDLDILNVRDLPSHVDWREAGKVCIGLLEIKKIGPSKDFCSPHEKSFNSFLLFITLTIRAVIIK